MINNILVIKGAFHLHNYVVDYRNSLVSSEADNYIDGTVFIEDMCNNNIVNMVVVNDNNRGEGGRPSNDEKQRHINGVSLGDKLCMILQNHNMQQPRKENGARVWKYDRSNHIQRT